MLERIQKAYTEEYSNVHRGLHYLSNMATEAYEDAREAVRAFLNAPSAEEIIFTRSSTEGINLVAQSFGGMRIKEGDEIVLSILEHHSNIVPWHFHRERSGAVIKWAPIHDDGSFDLEAFEKLLTERTKMVAIVHMSNVTGTVVPIKEVCRIAHERGIPVLVDGSQSAVHLPIDVQDLGCDFFVFTGHKTYGPSGIGVMWGRREHLDAMPPYMGGGEMIESVTEDWVTYGAPPHKFEAGTPPIVQAIGLAAALRYMESLGRDAIRAHEADLARICAGADFVAQLHPRLRQRAGEGRHRLLRDAGGARPRRLDHHRPGGDRGARGHALRPAAAAALRRHLHLPRLLRPLQHPRRGGRPCEGADEGPFFLRLTLPKPGLIVSVTYLVSLMHIYLTLKDFSDDQTDIRPWRHK